MKLNISSDKITIFNSSYLLISTEEQLVCGVGYCKHLEKPDEHSDRNFTVRTASGLA